MPLASILALLLIALGGAAIAVQAPVNARLARHLGDPVLAAAVSFGVGFVLLSAVSLLRGTLPSAAGLKGIPWWAWTGGALGMIYVVAAAWSVSRLGAVTLVAALILGQMVAALILDGSGAFGLVARPISALRIVSVVLVAAGVLLSRF